MDRTEGEANRNQPSGRVETSRSVWSLAHCSVCVVVGVLGGTSGTCSCCWAEQFGPWQGGLPNGCVCGPSVSGGNAACPSPQPACASVPENANPTRNTVSVPSRRANATRGRLRKAVSTEQNFNLLSPRFGPVSTVFRINLLISHFAWVAPVVRCKLPATSGADSWGTTN